MNAFFICLCQRNFVPLWNLCLDVSMTRDLCGSNPRRKTSGCSLLETPRQLEQNPNEVRRKCKGSNPCPAWKFPTLFNCGVNRMFTRLFVDVRAVNRLTLPIKSISLAFRWFQDLEHKAYMHSSPALNFPYVATWSRNSDCFEWKWKCKQVMCKDQAVSRVYKFREDSTLDQLINVNSHHSNVQVRIFYFKTNYFYSLLKARYHCFYQFFTNFPNPTKQQNQYDAILDYRRYHLLCLRGNRLRLPPARNCEYQRHRSAWKRKILQMLGWTEMPCIVLPEELCDWHLQLRLLVNSSWHFWLSTAATEHWEWNAQGRPRPNFEVLAGASFLWFGDIKTSERCGMCRSLFFFKSISSWDFS